MFTSKLNKRLRQVELKGSVGETAVTVIVGLNGYDYKTYKRQGQWSSTLGKNVHIAMNGPLQLTFDGLDKFLEELNDAVAHAQHVLLDL